MRDLQRDQAIVVSASGGELLNRTTRCVRVLALQSAFG
jgi:hypothetical protein